jgi:sulfatase modifying factor 1
MIMRNQIIYGVAFLAAMLHLIQPILAQGADKNQKIYEPEMVLVKGGSFQMGSSSGDDDEIPVHEVSISSYYLSKYEVTQSLWRQVMGSNPSFFKDCDQCPVESVSWIMVQDFLQKLNSITGKLYRLPTEAEWEFAALGGRRSEGFKYSGSNQIKQVGIFVENASERTHTVGQKLPNELGIYDMCGNVLEWCSDWKGEYSAILSVNPQGNSQGTERVLRGGSWKNSAPYCTSSHRHSYVPFNEGSDCGFRLAMSQGE